MFRRMWSLPPPESEPQPRHQQGGPSIQFNSISKILHLSPDDAGWRSGDTAPPVERASGATLAREALAARGGGRGGPQWRPREAACAPGRVLPFMRQAGGSVSGVKCRVFAIVHPRFFSRGKGLSLPAEPVSSNLLPCKGARRTGPTGDRRPHPAARLPAQTRQGRAWGCEGGGARLP